MYCKVTNGLVDQYFLKNFWQCSWGVTPGYACKYGLNPITSCHCKRLVWTYSRYDLDAAGLTPKVTFISSLGDKFVLFPSDQYFDNVWSQSRLYFHGCPITQLFVCRPDLLAYALKYIYISIYLYIQIH